MFVRNFEIFVTGSPNHLTLSQAGMPLGISMVAATMRHSLLRNFFLVKTCQLHAAVMNATYLMLGIANNRLEFWRDQLQAAFRAGNAQRAAECDRFIEEYGLLTNEVLTKLRSVDHDTRVAS